MMPNATTRQAQFHTIIWNLRKQTMLVCTFIQPERNDFLAAIPLIHHSVFDIKVSKSAR